MEISFHGKRALVTGAGKGIGREVALKLAECGAEVVAVSRTQSDLDNLMKENSKIQPLYLDVGNWELTKKALKNVGFIDLLVNNAAIYEPKEYGELTEEDCDRVFDINIKALINIGQMIAQDMKARGKGGAIVNVSSVLGFAASPTFGTYCASKGAVDQITRSMAIEFGPNNIRVNSINPTVIRTRLSEGFLKKDKEAAQNIIKRTPIGRIGEPEDVAYPILFLLSDKAAMITGITLPVDGGIAINIF